MECTCCASLSRRANDILKALSGNTKPVYANRIPETLTPEHFNLHETFHHGFPSQPMCLAYDPVQRLLAIGTEDGEVLLLGKPGLEKHFSHPMEVCILQMTFITNKGRLVTSCDNKTLYLWSLEGKSPRVLHQLEFRIEIPTAISCMHGSQWMYVGTDTSNVYVVNVETFQLSGYWIRWKDTIDVCQLDKPGDVIAVQEHPMDQGKVVIAFSCGMCALWDLKRKVTEGRFFYSNRQNIVLTSMCWLGNGRSFACSYSDGCIAVWNPTKPGNKPEKTFHHESDCTAFKRVHKLQFINTNSGPWYIYSEGFRDDSPKSLIVKESKSSSMFSTASPILDFLYLPSSPFPHDCQKPFALVVLTRNELIVHDLQTSGYPSFNLPYALDFHLPPVTCVQYCGDCPDELIASLHSVKSKQVAENKSTKPWPLMGGKWGQETPHVSTDLIVTGHTDGSVRLWVCSSVIVQPLYTMSTFQYFKSKQNGFVPQLDTLVEEETPGVVLEQENGEREILQDPRRTPSPATGQAMKPTARRRMMNYLRNVTRTSSSSTLTHSEVEGSTSTPLLLLDGSNACEGTPTASPDVFVFAPSGNEYYFAIQEIHVCVHGLWMCVANMGGGVMAFDFKMGGVATVPKSLDICFNYDSILKAEGIPGISPCAVTKPFDEWVLREGISDSLPGFNLVQHCLCYYSCCSGVESEPSIVSSMRYSSEIGMLAIGTDQGFAVVDTITNGCLYTLSNLTSILSMTNPTGEGGRRKSSPAPLGLTSPKPTIQRHASLRSISTACIKVMTPTTPSSAQGFLLPEPRRDSSVFAETVAVSECSVTALEVVQLQMDPQAPPTLTLWVGLASGHVAAYDISITWPENVGFGPPERILRLKLIPLINFVADRKSPIVKMQFLNEWGDLQVVPYKPLTVPREGGRRRSSDQTQSKNPLHYVIITDENKIQSFSFPRFLPVSKITSSDRDNIILQSEYFTCNDLPCLLSLTSFEQILVHSLPGLKPLLKLPFPFLGDSRVLRTFRVSGNGQIMFMSSASTIQRMSLAKDDRLNLPACLPDMYVRMTEPKCIHGRETPKVIDREQMFGASAGRRRIGVVERPPLHAPAVGGASRVGGVSGAYSDMKRAAHMRRKKLEESVNVTTGLAHRAHAFSASSHHQ